MEIKIYCENEESNSEVDKENIIVNMDGVEFNYIPEIKIYSRLTRMEDYYEKASARQKGLQLLVI